MVIYELRYEVSEKEGVDLTDEQCEEICEAIDLSDINQIVLYELERLLPFQDKLVIKVE